MDMNHYRIYPEHKLIHTWTTGTDFKSLMGFYKEVAADPGFSKEYSGIADIED